MSAMPDVESTTDYRIGRVERELAEVRARVESGQGAMLQAVSSIQTQLAQFQITLSTDLSNRFLSRTDADELRREVRERANTNKERLDRYDAIYVRALDEARTAAQHKQDEDAEHTLRVNLALLGSGISLLGGILLHFIKLPGA